MTDTGDGSTPGIIPAYAGSTSQLLIIHSTVQDHPRVCGEHSPHFVTKHNGHGSSPRMRGAQLAAFLGIDGIRIIPAYAGSTFVLTSIYSEGGDHPRVCGEHPLYMLI